MNKLVKKLTKEKHHLLLSVLLAIFIIFDVSVPIPIANLIDTIVGKTVVIIVIFGLITFNKFIGVLAVVAGYMLFMRAMNVSSNAGFRYLETEKNKSVKMQSFNKKSNISVEEEIINNMLPRVANEYVKSSHFKPVQNNLHSAEKI